MIEQQRPESQGPKTPQSKKTAQVKKSQRTRKASAVSQNNLVKHRSLLPNKSPDDTDVGWSETSETSSLHEFYKREKPPHWSSD